MTIDKFFTTLTVSRRCVVVPHQLQIMTDHRTSIMVGHFSAIRLFMILSKRRYWEEMGVT